MPHTRDLEPQARLAKSEVSQSTPVASKLRPRARASSGEARLSITCARDLEVQARTSGSEDRQWNHTARELGPCERALGNEARFPISDPCPSPRQEREFASGTKQIPRWQMLARSRAPKSTRPTTKSRRRRADRSSSARYHACRACRFHSIKVLRAAPVPRPRARTQADYARDPRRLSDPSRYVSSTFPRSRSPT